MPAETELSAERLAERRLQKRNVEVFDSENNAIAGTSLES